jgi:hypothetical protein
MANRLWQWHFGKGIVGTPNDFGVAGEKPSHPELLDWLACELRARGSLKDLHRLIVLSNTYQQSSSFDNSAAAVDAESRLLWRYPPRRLEGEAVRDALLAVGGTLNPEIGGPSFRPFTVTEFNSFFFTLTDADTPATSRRSVYRMNVNSARDPLLEALDCPDPSVKTPRRAVTTTPLQALGMMNGSFVHRQARALADRAVRESGPDLATQVARAYVLVLGRPPRSEEREEAVAVARRHGLATVCWALVNCNEFLYVR